MTNLSTQLFSAWMGPGDMSSARQTALNSIVFHCGVPVSFITYKNFKSWIHPDFPIHPAFPLLSAVHQCDYLRCYTLHVYGGGYTDIKPTTHNWKDAFDLVKSTKDIFGAGYTEIGPHGVARVGGNLEVTMQENYHKLIGLCAMIMFPRTAFSQKWYEILIGALDHKITALIQNPARHPQDHLGANFDDGTVSKYPFRWTELGGDIFHPLVFQHNENFMHIDLAPSFVNYR
jgi:hypothetical protein